MVKGAKTIAEYAIKKWLGQEGFVMECFHLEMTGPCEATIIDGNGDKLRLVYDTDSKVVFPLTGPI